VRIGVTALGDMICDADALITVTDSLLPEARIGCRPATVCRGTRWSTPGKLWRSRYDAEQNLIVVNSGHRDFIYASRAKALVTLSGASMRRKWCARTFLDCPPTNC
jgi:hypothetical protein